MLPENSAFESPLHPESDFRAAMAAAGLDYPGDIIPDGQLHRVKVNGDRGPNSWYVLHLDGLPAGSYGCWKRGIAETWCAKTGDVLTDTERAERDRLWAKQREERDADRRRTNDEARAQAQAILDAARPATDDHPYLKRKGVQAHPGVMVGHWPQRQRDNCLLIPLRAAGGQLATVQAILPDRPSDGRNKDFLRGGAKQGAFFALGDLAAAPVIAIAEGYATAATIHEVTGHCAVMAVDAGNLKPVAEAIRAAFPSKRLVIAADNDRHTEGNPGITKATIAAQVVKADLAVPGFAEGEAGTDFNDLAQRRGASAVRQAIEQARPAQGEGAEAAEAVDDAQLARLFQTDLGNSERLVARYGCALRYCFDFGKWLVWDGIRWAIDRNGAALDKAKATARAMLAEAATLGDREDSRKLAAWSFKSQARDRMSAMLYLAQPDVSTRPEQLDTHPWLLNVLNGTLDLRTGTLRKPDRADLLTKAAPVVYDPTARCEQWLSFLNRIFDGNTDLIRFVQKAAGYSLTGLDTEECFFVLHGVGQNGKSTVVETLSALLGTDYAQQATPELLMQKKQERHPTELAVLRGARLVASVETGQGKRLNEALIKSMTGGDRIRANFMHQDTFEFRPEFKVWLSTNHKPVITGTDLGIWRRIRMIPFTVKIPDEERDGAFKTRLREPAALSGILNWALAGVLLWQREGLKPPAAVTEATQAYREEMDVLAAWIADCCVVKKLAEASAADLYRSYVQWREQNGERPETQTSFGLRLTERGFERVKRRNGWVWYGIGLLACDPCDPCDPKSVIKEANSGEGFKNTENRVTPVTPVTPRPADDGLKSQHHVDSTVPRCATCLHLVGHRCQLRAEVIEHPDVGSCRKWEVTP